ncbi:hypothetical protein KQX54_015445 [Cotesia glomerata]|uniref:Uncharacterized protein n=1 Tax=Cotesia glomerata TaxID=32391 RepID=A0AAV7IBR7_COTGL|nr:hypothetical protein KQX54_015445 [Cotesia glomerata]
MNLPLSMVNVDSMAPSPEYSDSLNTAAPLDLDRFYDLCNCETKIRSTKNVSIDPSPRYFGEHDKMTGEKSPILTSMTSPRGFDSKIIGDKYIDEPLTDHKSCSRRIKDLTHSENSCFNQIQDVKGNYVRRIASSESIPYALSKRENYTRDYQTIDETCCVRRVNSPDVRQLRYIQSAKGAWSYNL